MNPLRYREVDKLPGFDREMLHIRDNCYLLTDSQFINIVFEHDDSLEYHGLSRSAMTKNTIKYMLNQPVLKAVDNTFVDIMASTVESRTIKEASTCSELRSVCKRWKDSHYLRKLYEGYRGSVYAFIYSIDGDAPMINIQAVNYGQKNMKGSFTIRLDLMRLISNYIC